MRVKRGACVQAAGLRLAAFLSVSAAVFSVHAAEPASHTPVFSANIGWASDYAFRGFTQTREKPAVQGGLDVTLGWFYAGLWATNVDFGTQRDAFGHPHDPAQYEVELYGGIKRKFGMSEYNLGVIYYAYPGADGFPDPVVPGLTGDPSFVEITGGVSSTIQTGLTAGLTTYYSPDYFGEVGRNWIFEGILRKTLPKLGSINPAVSGTLAYSAGDESEGGIDYFYWNAGFSFIFLDYFEFDLRYFDAFDVPSEIDCTDRCDGRVVARITFEY